jgi:hypothetical protein
MLTHRSCTRTTISMLFTLCFCAVLKTPAILLLDLPARCGNEGAAAHSLQTPGSCSLAEIGGAPDRKWRRNRMHQRSSCELTRKQHVMVATCACATHLITVVKLPRCYMMKAASFSGHWATHKRGVRSQSCCSIYSQAVGH